MKVINKIATIILKILEVSHWVATVLMAVATVSSLVAPQRVTNFVEFDIKDYGRAELSVYGFGVDTLVTNGDVDMTAFFLFGIGATIILELMAMVFRNLYLIFRKLENTMSVPKDNICLIKEIGIFSIAIPVVEFIMSIIIRLVISTDIAEVSVSLSSVIMGIIVFCLTKYFTNGNALQKM